MRFEEEIKTTKFHDEIQKAHLNIIFTAGWLRARISACLKPYHISFEQYNVLRIVRGQQEHGIRVKDITHRMLERNSNTTRIIDRLESKGLVQRLTTSQDRRERTIRLTYEGAELLLAIDRDWEYNNPHTAPLSASDAQAVNCFLDRIREA